MSARRGLVVVGGGAKGAFSFGCMKALRESGIEFVAVSGTSAGALNAAIWSSGSITAGETVWAQATPATTYDREAKFKALPRPIARLSSIASVVLTVLTARYNDYPIEDKVARWVDWTLQILKVAAITTAVLTVSDFGIFWNTTIVAIFSVLLRTKKSEKLRSSDLPHAAGVSLFASLALFAWVYDRPSYIFPQVEPSLMSGIIVGMFFLLQFDAMRTALIRQIFIPLRWSVLDSRPLANTIMAFLTENPLKIPTYVTVATKKEYVDPNDQYWSGVWRKGQSGFQKERSPWRMRTKFGWVPVYVRVESLDVEDAAQWLLASAALPFGIVPPVLASETSYVDGGIVDNVPILPLLSHNLDEIWILHLAPIDSTCSDGQAERQRCDDISKLVHESQSGFPAEVASGERPPLLAFEDYVSRVPSMDKWPKLISLYPQSGLGGVFDGLLNFSPTYTTSLIHRGYMETLAFLNTNDVGRSIQHTTFVMRESTPAHDSVSSPNLTDT